MKLLIMSQNNSIDKIQKVLTKKGYAHELAVDIETYIGKESGVKVDIKDKAPADFILDIGSEFTEKEKTYDIGITPIKED